MRTSIFALASCLCLLTPVAVSAQSAPPAPAMQNASDANDSHRMVCRYSYFEGSVIRHRECHTQAYWDNMRFQSQRELTNFQMRSLTTSKP
jgi:hypothetical protein